MTSTEFISNISSIIECDAQGLGFIFSIGLETINNYQEACTELKRTQKLANHFSDRAKGTSENPYMATTSDLIYLEMTDKELGTEVVKRIGVNYGFQKMLYSDHLRGGCSKKNAKKLQDIFEQEIEDWKTRYEKASVALEENNKFITLIPPDYRYWI